MSGEVNAYQGAMPCTSHQGQISVPIPRRKIYGAENNGRQCIAEAMTVLGNDTSSARTKRSVNLAELEAFDALGRMIGMIKGPLKRGPKYKTLVEISGLDLMAQRIVPSESSKP